jgi:hypothetical protein
MGNSCQMWVTRVIAISSLRFLLLQCLNNSHWPFRAASNLSLRAVSVAASIFLYHFSAHIFTNSVLFICLTLPQDDVPPNTGTFLPKCIISRRSVNFKRTNKLCIYFNTPLLTSALSKQRHAYHNWWAEGRLVGGRRGYVGNIFFFFIFKYKQTPRFTEIVFFFNIFKRKQTVYEVSVKLNWKSTESMLLILRVNEGRPKCFVNENGKRNKDMEIHWSVSMFPFSVSAQY